MAAGAVDIYGRVAALADASIILSNGEIIMHVAESRARLLFY